MILIQQYLHFFVIFRPKTVLTLCQKSVTFFLKLIPMGFGRRTESTTRFSGINWIFEKFGTPLNKKRNNFLDQNTTKNWEKNQKKEKRGKKNPKKPKNQLVYSN